MAVSRSETVEVNGSSFLDTVDAHIDHAMQYLTLTDGLATRIRECNSTYMVNFGVRLRGKMCSFTGWRSVHSEHQYHVKGGEQLEGHTVSQFQNPFEMYISSNMGR